MSFLIINPHPFSYKRKISPSNDNLPCQRTFFDSLYIVLISSPYRISEISLSLSQIETPHHQYAGISQFIITRCANLNISKEERFRHWKQAIIHSSLLLHHKPCSPLKILLLFFFSLIFSSCFLNIFAN